MTPQLGDTPAAALDEMDAPSSGRERRPAPVSRQQETATAALTSPS